MDFGNRTALDATVTPVPDPTVRLAWFERSSGAEQRFPVTDEGLAEGNGLLDRLREGDGLVYNGEGDYEN